MIDRAPIRRCCACDVPFRRHIPERICFACETSILVAMEEYHTGDS
jgi:hypothetical protein